MTTELEQEFFKVFGIEPIEYRKNVPCLNFLSSGMCNITDERCNPSKCNEYRPDKTDRLWRDFMEVYPEITDHKLLEMICIFSQHCNFGRWNKYAMHSIDDFEYIMLSQLIEYQNKRYTYGIKEKIQQLFKEGE